MEESGGLERQKTERNGAEHLEKEKGINESGMPGWSNDKENAFF